MNSKVIIFFVTMVLFSQALNLKKKITTSTTSSNQNRYIWKTSNSQRQDCWGSCTSKNGFACGYGNQGRWTSDKYQCTKNQAICTSWLDSFELCRSTGCKGWESRNIKQHDVLSVYC